MQKVIRETRVLLVKHGNWNGPGGSWQTTAPTQQVTVDLEIDIERIWSNIGQHAARNKSGRAVEGSGMIVARRRK